MAVRRIDDGKEFEIEYPRVRDLLKSALAHSTNPDGEEGLFKGLLDRRYLLWTDANSAAVTQIMEWDEQLVCIVYLAAGDMEEITTGMYEIQKWAFEKGCKGMTFFGRRGWDRVLNKHGFKLSSCVFFKEF
jgi:hypothetical protein